jgi:NAD(P)-dependent dehydrogenase (short-subunit alcohol dehydrogenase family)
MSIEDRSVVIIGGSSGIGLAIAKEAVDAGAAITIAGRSQAKLDEACRAIAGDVGIRTVDVSDEQSVKSLFSQIGPFDHLVVTALGRALAVELAPVRVNVVSPGLTDTPAYAGMPDDVRVEMFAAAAKRSLVGRVGRPEDIASLTLELMCNSFMTGVVVDVDGGGLLAG